MKQKSDDKQIEIIEKMLECTEFDQEFDKPDKDEGQDIDSDLKNQILTDLDKDEESEGLLDKIKNFLFDRDKDLDIKERQYILKRKFKLKFNKAEAKDELDDWVSSENCDTPSIKESEASIESSIAAPMQEDHQNLATIVESFGFQFEEYEV